MFYKTKVKVYGRDGCPWCDKVNAQLTSAGIEFEYINTTGNKEQMEFVRQEWGTFPMVTVEVINRITKKRRGPAVVGGYQEVSENINLMKVFL